MNLTDPNDLHRLCQNLPSIINFTEQQRMYGQLESFLARPENLRLAMAVASRTPTCLFTIAQTLSKYIQKAELQNGAFCQPNNYRETNYEVLTSLIDSMQPFICSQHFPQFAVRSCCNLVSICLKHILTSLGRIDTLKLFFTAFLPGFQVNDQFLISYATNIIICQPKNANRPPYLHHAIQILISLLQNVIQSTSYRTYYEYRKNMYSFKNNYLAAILQVAIWYFKIHVEQTMQPVMNSILRLMDTLVSFPFTLSIQEFEYDEELRENSVGEIYFPSYFRNITEDIDLIHMLLRCHKWLSQPSIELLRVVGRLASANSYFFETEAQRRRFRQAISGVITEIIATYKSTEENYTVAMLELAFRILNSYNIKDYDLTISYFIQNTLMMCQFVVHKCSIRLDSRQFNTTSRALQVMSLCLEECKSAEVREFLRYSHVQVQIAVQNGLSVYIQRLLNAKEAQQILQFKFKNYERQIDTFQEIFKPAISIFKQDISVNFRKIAQVDLKTLSAASLTIWTHFMTTLLSELPDEGLMREQTGLFLDLLNHVQFKEDVSTLRLISVIVSKMLDKVDYSGAVCTNFWLQFYDLTQSDLTTFIQVIMEKCTHKMHEFSDFVDYSLELLSSLYSKLKKVKVAQLEQFSQIMKKILIGLQMGIFSQPLYFHKRVKLYSIINTLTLETYDPQNIYEAYQYVRRSISQQISPQNFLKFIYDMTGLIQNMQSHTILKILVELLLNDIKLLKIPYFQGEEFLRFVQDKTVLKAYVRFVHALTHDSSRRITMSLQSRLALDLEQLLKESVIYCSKVRISRKMLKILRDFVRLCPIRWTVPFPAYTSQDVAGKQLELKETLSVYFEHIHRVEDISTLYNWMKDTVQFVNAWYEEAMNRGLPLGNTNFKELIESRIWSTTKEKQTMARLYLAVGTYEPSMAMIPELFVGLPDEQTFVKRFLSHFT